MIAGFYVSVSIFVNRIPFANFPHFPTLRKHSQEPVIGTSLVGQWLRILLPMQGIWVRALGQEDSTCHGATKPVRHNY